MAIDRKALIRQYKETTPSMGVGVVRNKTTGLALVVAGRDLPSLLNRHRAQLRLNAQLAAAGRCLARAVGTAPGGAGHLAAF